MNFAIVVSIISLLFCFFFFLYVKWYIKRRISTEQILGEHRTEVYRLIAEIDSVTDRDSRLVEDRIKQLKAILEETDKRVGVYARELERSRQGEALYTSLGRGIRAAVITPEPVAPPAAQIAPQILPAPQPPSAQAASQQAQSIPQPTPEPATEPEPPVQLRVQIETLASQGLSPEKIASRLGISLSEVDLALALLRRG